MEVVKIIECPRDAMQGIKDFIPTETKIDYINKILSVGFDTVDFGSFVSPKTIPQMKDTAKVLEGLDLSQTTSKLLSIIPNEHGAKDAASFEEIHYFGYPFSISETFQQRNTNTSIEGSLKRLENICTIAENAKKRLVVYLSMGFGNPYNDLWNADIVTEWAVRLSQTFNIESLAISDTIGVANPERITAVLNQINKEVTLCEIGAHLHIILDTYDEKLEAAYNANCRRFDGAIRGFGGCPMAEDKLVGNMPTEKMIQWFENQSISTGLDQQKLNQAIVASNYVFNH